MVSVETKDKVGVQGSAGIQAGLFELARVGEGGSMEGSTVNRVSAPFVAVRNGCIGGPFVSRSGVVVLVHHDGPG